DREKGEFFFEMAATITEDDELYDDFLQKLTRKNKFSSIYKYLKNFKKYGKKVQYKRTKEYPGVVLSTAHSSKGMEFPVVFLSISKFHTKECGSGNLNTPTLEEARRLLFVSITRAKEEITITGQFIAFGKKDDYTINHFLKEVYDVLGKEFNPNINKHKREKQEREKEERAELASKRRNKKKADLMSELLEKKLVG
ncbi:MAG: hypothetical protein K6G11_07125, partial [Lachnospiraceae bacterium]|nr:hypothetical protein [Lachnospiraceae bacterium]